MIAKSTFPAAGSTFPDMTEGRRQASPDAARGARVRALREALEAIQPGEWSQGKVAERSGGLTREEINKIENAGKGLGTERNRAALARAYDLSRDDVAALVDGEMSVEEALRARGRRRSAPATFASAPQWAAWVEAIRARHPEWEEDAGLWGELGAAEWPFGSIARLTEAALEQFAATVFAIRKRDRIGQPRKITSGIP